MRRSIRLSFTTDSGTRAHISVPHAPAAPPTGAATRAAMQAIIDTGIVRLNAGLLTGIDSARHIGVEETRFSLG